MPVIEVLANTTRLEKPGWTYVLDTGYSPTKPPIQQSGSRKRNARVAETSESNLSSKQSSALAKRLAEHDRDNARDVAVLLSSKQKSKPRNATTKKIIDSQRSFAHYLAEEEATSILDHESSHGKQRTARPKSEPNISATYEIYGEPDINVKSVPSPKGHWDQGLPPVTTQSSPLPNEMRLLQVATPSPPPIALMQSLTSTTPVSWGDARAKPSNSGLPLRYFCEICGYWGCIKCVVCGARLCGLQCKLAHNEDRCQKYSG